MTCNISAPDGDDLRVTLEDDGQRSVATLLVNGVPCHLERLPAEEALRYKLDADPDYRPRCDPEGYTYVLVPYSRS